MVVAILDTVDRAQTNAISKYVLFTHTANVLTEIENICGKYIGMDRILRS